MEPGQSTKKKVTDISVGEDTIRFSVKLGAEHEAKLLALMTENGTYGRTTKIPKATGVRALLEISNASVEFLGVVRMIIAKEREMRKERRKGSNKEKPPMPFPVVLLPSQRNQMDSLTAFCLANELSCAAGTIIRALIESTEPSPEFTKHLKKVHDKEREKWFERQRWQV